ncbi:MAG: leucine-rich repeat domain-containing protein [Clostridia bacterium]|nr:leucine-rich repeat domain-containing protein [Clostridia bacterium]
MKIKKLLCVLLALLLSVCASCAFIGEEGSTTDNSDQNGTDAPATDAERLAYYENLVTSLQAEILAIKAELHATKTEYENRIEEMESEKNDTAQQAEFTYTVSGNSVTVTAYNGKSVSVQIPALIDGKAVTAIGDKTFLNNTTVQSVVIPEGVKTVGWFAFSGCVSLGAVSLPSSVESISYGAFENCNRALTVFCPAGSYAESYARSYGIATAN